MGAIISLCLILHSHLVLLTPHHTQSGTGCACVWDWWSQSKVPRGDSKVWVSSNWVDATVWPYATCIACVHLWCDCITVCQLALVAQVHKAQSCFIPEPNPHTAEKLAHKTHTTARKLDQRSSTNQSSHKKNLLLWSVTARNNCMLCEFALLSLHGIINCWGADKAESKKCYSGTFPVSFLKASL